MAQPKDAELGVQGVFPVRVGLDHQEWLGLNKQRDPGAIQDTEFVLGINIRVSESYIQERGGQSKDSGPATGCVVGIFDLGGPTLDNAILLMNGISRAPNANASPSNPFYSFEALTDTYLSLSSATDIVPIAGVGLGGFSTEYDGVAPAIQVTNQYQVPADSVMPLLANGSNPRIRSFLSSQGQIYVTLEPVLLSAATGQMGSPIATLTRAASSNISSPVPPSPATYTLQVLFNLPHAAWDSCEWNGEQWWIGPAINGSGYGSIMLSHWDGTTLTTETVLVRSGSGGINVQIIGFHEQLCCCLVGQIIARDMNGNFVAHAMPGLPLGGFAFYTNAVVEFGNKIYMFGGVPGIDGASVGQNVMSWDGTTFVFEHNVPPRANNQDDSDGMYDATVLGGLIWYTVRTPLSDSSSPNDAFIGCFDGTTWTDERYVIGSPVANFIISLGSYNGNLVAGFLTGTKGQSFGASPTGQAGIIVFNPFETISDFVYPGSGVPCQMCVLPWTDSPGGGMNGWPQAPGEFLNA